MEVSAPWLDKSFFVEILQSEEGSKERCGLVSVINCTSEPGVDSACNFMSSIVRVKVEYKLESKDETLIRSFIVKIPLWDNIVNDIIFIENEIQMYKDFIPRVQSITQLEIFPKSYKSSWDNCLVMEDLKEAGYVMCKSDIQLDHKQAKAALVALAKFHAASVAVKHKYPECMECNGVETCYTNDPKYADIYKPRILMRLYGLASVLKTIDNCEKFGDILMDVGEEFWDLMVELFRPNSKLNVLNHGDFWKNNILFKYDSSGLVSGVKFVDFQMRRYCSPGIDLLYLFWTSADSGVRLRMYELLELYRHTLNNSLAELECPERLLRHELKEEILKCSPIILLLCLYLPVIFPDPNCLPNANQCQTSEENVLTFDFDVNPLLIPFKGKHYRPALLEICKEVENMKLFQILVKNKKEKK